MSADPKSPLTELESVLAQMTLMCDGIGCSYPTSAKDDCLSFVWNFRHELRAALQARMHCGGETIAGYMTFGQYEGRPIALAHHAAATTVAVAASVMEVARKEGFKGTFSERMEELGWDIRPVYTAPQNDDLAEAVKFIAAKTRGIPAAFAPPKTHEVFQVFCDEIANQIETLADPSQVRSTATEAHNA